MGGVRGLRRSFSEGFHFRGSRLAVGKGPKHSVTAWGAIEPIVNVSAAVRSLQNLSGGAAVGTSSALCPPGPDCANILLSARDSTRLGHELPDVVAVRWPTDERGRVRYTRGECQQGVDVWGTW